MTRTRTLLRRTTMAVALTGAVTFGSVALSPAAFADDDDRSTVSVDHDDRGDVVDGSPAYVVSGKGKGGPVAFLVTERGRKAIFFCEPAKPTKRQNVCQPDPRTAPDRF